MKVYEFNGKHYCEEDISIEDEKYDGDLYDLYWELKKEGQVSETTSYYIPGNEERIYSEPEELVEENFSDLVVGEIEL